MACRVSSYIATCHYKSARSLNQLITHMLFTLHRLERLAQSAARYLVQHSCAGDYILDALNICFCNASLQLSFI